MTVVCESKKKWIKGNKEREQNRERERELRFSLSELRQREREKMMREKIRSKRGMQRTPKTWRDESGGSQSRGWAEHIFNPQERERKASVVGYAREADYQSGGDDVPCVGGYSIALEGLPTVTTTSLSFALGTIKKRSGLIKKFGSQRKKNRVSRGLYCYFQSNFFFLSILQSFEVTKIEFYPIYIFNATSPESRWGDCDFFQIAILD